jgi:hypothetical protein
MLTHNEILEIGKIMSDFFKQLTTLDTGMVVIIITIVEKVFTPEKVLNNIFKKSLFLASLIAFIVSLMLSLRALVVIPVRLSEILQGGSVGAWVDDFSFYVSIYSFILGIILFIILAIISFYTRQKLKQGHRTI